MMAAQCEQLQSKDRPSVKTRNLEVVIPLKYLFSENLINVETRYLFSLREKFNIYL